MAATRRPALFPISAHPTADARAGIPPEPPYQFFGNQEDEQASRVAKTTIAIFGGLIPLALNADAGEQGEWVIGLKRALTAYIADVDHRAAQVFEPW